MAEASVILAIGAAGAFHRAGLAFPLPPRWESEQGDWSDDDRVREALDVDDDDEAEKLLRKRLKQARLTDAAELVMRRRYQEVALGVREDDSTLARIARAVHDGAMDYLLPAAVRRMFDTWERQTKATMRDLARRLGVDELRAEDVLADTDARIDAAVKRAGYALTQDDELRTVSMGSVDLAPMVEVGGAGVTLAPIFPGMVGGYMLEQGAKSGLKWWGKGVGGTLLKGGAQLGKEAQDTVNDGKLPFGIGVAVGVAAVVAILYITRR